jgi:uncharacterized membrane protein YhhN
LGGVSAAASAVFGLWFAPKSASLVRGAVKTAAVGALAVLAYVEGAPESLIGALMLSAIGDAVLAGEAERWRPLGLLAFILAQLSYVVLFVLDGGGRAALIAEPVRSLGVAAAFAACVTLLAWLWRAFGELRGAASLFILTLCLAAATSFTLPHRLWPAMAGASALVAAGGILSAELFKGVRTAGAACGAWSLYYVAQAAILWAYLR